MATAIHATPPPRANPAAKRQLTRAAQAVFWAFVVGQGLFALYVLMFYGPATATGNLAAWNNKPHITGYVPGDAAGNFALAAHVFMAAVMITAGLIQLVPQVRQRWPRLHRWSGRTFLVLAFALALGGLWLVWVRGSYLNLVSAAAISVDAVLILGFGFLAWRAAMDRDFAAHRRWALRTFIVASAVWFMRVGYIVWGVLTGGAGIARGMSGPFDLFWAFATYLLPLAVLELYLRAERGQTGMQRAVTLGLWLAALMLIGGSIGAWLLMWWPAITA